MSEEIKPEEIQKNYPTQPDQDGYYFENQDDELFEIKTKTYPNGMKTKTLILANGDIAVVRQLKGKDAKEIERYTGKNIEKHKTASITVSTTVNDKKETFEYYEDLLLKDYGRLVSMFSDLNF